MSRSRLLRIVALLALLALAALPVVSCSSGERTIVVKHGAVTPPVLVPGGVEGTTVGDTRYFDIAGTTADGAEVRIEAIMFTTAVNPGTTDELRDTRLSFTFKELADQVIVEGIGLYPGEGSTIAPQTTIRRPITGGSGTYAGATGWAESTHEADGTWTHTLHIN